MTVKRGTIAKVLFTIPNAISVARIVVIPFVVMAMLQGAWATSFALFVLAGVSDGIDGYIARNFHQRSQLGVYLDPLADKGLSIAVFSTFAALGIVPVWLVGLIIARDVAIVGGATLLAARGRAEEIRPLLVSKVNTVVLIVLASWLLAAETFGWSLAWLTNSLVAVVVLLTAFSAAAYGRLMVRNVGSTQQKDGAK